MTRRRHPSRLSRPDQYLRALLSDVPRLADMVNHLRDGRGKDLPDWPDWCLLPMSGWDAINHPPRRPLYEMAAVGTWAFSRGIYRFDPTIAASLAETTLSDALPASVFYRLPEYCLFLEMPDMHLSEIPISGVWAHLEWDTNRKRPELRLAILAEEFLYPVILHLGNWSLRESIQRAIDEVVRERQLERVPFTELDMAEMLPEITPVISMLLYLCSRSPEIDPLRQPGQSSYQPSVAVVRDHKLRTAPKSIIFEVGKRTGQP